MNTQMLLISGLALVAGAFIFKDQICPTIPIPFICDSVGEELISGPGSVPAKSSVQLPNGMTRYLACDIETDPNCYQSRYASPQAPPQVLPAAGELIGDTVLSRL